MTSTTTATSRVYLAPMVQGSELAFRMLVRKYNSTATVLLTCYTPMLRARHVLAAHRYWKIKQQEKSTIDPACETFLKLHEDAQLCLLDNRTIREQELMVQICSHCPLECKEATHALLELHESFPLKGIDFNLGCPQECAAKDGFGAFLAEQTPDQAIACVKAMSDAIREYYSSSSRETDDDEASSKRQRCREEQRPQVSCKIRLQETYAATLKLAQRLQDEAGCELLAVHCRRRTDKHNGLALLEDGTKLVQVLRIPVVLNGAEIQCLDDVNNVLQQTGAHAVMAARAFLEHPDLLILDRKGQQHIHSPNAAITNPINPALMAADYLEFATKYPPPTPLYIRKHLRWIFRSTLQPVSRSNIDYSDWRPRLWTFLVRPYLETMDQFRAVVLLYIQLWNEDSKKQNDEGSDDVTTQETGVSKEGIAIPESLQGLPVPTFKTIRNAKIRK